MSAANSIMSLKTSLVTLDFGVQDTPRLAESNLVGGHDGISIPSPKHRARRFPDLMRTLELRVQLGMRFGIEVSIVSVELPAGDIGDRPVPPAPCSACFPYGPYVTRT